MGEMAGKQPIPILAAKAARQNQIKTGYAKGYWKVLLPVVAVMAFSGCAGSYQNNMSKEVESMGEPKLVSVKTQKDTAPKDTLHLTPVKIPNEFSDSSTVQKDSQLVLSPKAKKLVEKRLQELDSEDKAINDRVPGGRRGEPPISARERMQLLRDSYFNYSETCLYGAVVTGTALQALNKIANELVGEGRFYDAKGLVGTNPFENEQAALKIIEKFEKTTNIKLSIK